VIAGLEKIDSVVADAVEISSQAQREAFMRLPCAEAQPKIRE
jgi:hypothetical protein